MSQSCGRQTAAVRLALSGSCSASHRSFETVNAAKGTLPTACAHASAPNSDTSASASGADLVSFHKSAGRMTFASSSRQIMPCCCAAIEIEAIPSRPPASASAVCRAFHQLSGSTSVESGCWAHPLRTRSPVAASRTTTLHDCVDESTPATSVTAGAGSRAGQVRGAGGRRYRVGQRAPRTCSTAS